MNLQIENIYTVKDGYNHHNGKKLFRVIGLVYDYVGEWHTEREEAEKEQRKLFDEYEPKTHKLIPFAKKVLHSQLSNLNPGDPRGCPWIDFIPTILENVKFDTITGCTYIYPTQEEEEQAKREQEEAERKEQEAKANKYNHVKHPFIDLNNSERWTAGLEELEKENAVIEMCEESYWYFLECVPPKDFDGSAYVSGEPHHDNKKGEPVYLCAIKQDGKFFAQYGTVQQFKKRELFKKLPAVATA